MSTAINHNRTDFNLPCGTSPAGRFEAKLPASFFRVAAAHPISMNFTACITIKTWYVFSVVALRRMFFSIYGQGFS
ncbi:MAG TPA: hypothetical protein VGO59_13165 [Verrucomicrobiae bacterium]